MPYAVLPSSCLSINHKPGKDRIGRDKNTANTDSKTDGFLQQGYLQDIFPPCMTGWRRFQAISSTASLWLKETTSILVSSCRYCYSMQLQIIISLLLRSISTVNPIKLETGLRPNSAGITYYWVSNFSASAVAALVATQ